MEEAISQDLLQVRFHSKHGQLLPVHSQLIKLTDALDLDTGAVLHVNTSEVVRSQKIPGTFSQSSVPLAEPVGTLALLCVVNFLHTQHQCLIRRLYESFLSAQANQQDLP